MAQALSYWVRGKPPDEIGDWIERVLGKSYSRKSIPWLMGRWRQYLERGVKANDKVTLEAVEQFKVLKEC